MKHNPVVMWQAIKMLFLGLLCGSLLAGLIAMMVASARLEGQHTHPTLEEFSNE